jgi:hypothetical protein
MFPLSSEKDMKTILSLSMPLHMNGNTLKNVAPSASETEVPRREVDKSKLAITAGRRALASGRQRPDRGRAGCCAPSARAAGSEKRVERLGDLVGGRVGGQEDRHRRP